MAWRPFGRGHSFCVFAVGRDFPPHMAWGESEIAAPLEGQEVPSPPLAEGQEELTAAPEDYQETNVSTISDLEIASPPPLRPYSSKWDMIKGLGAFALVLVLLMVALKTLGRLGRFKALKGRSTVFTMRGILPLDNRKYLAAVEVDGRLLIVGVSQDNINRLAQWPLNKDDITFQEEEPRPEQNQFQKLFNLAAKNLKKQDSNV
ncbi:MAG: flagellar biosynthetic protein FliO [Candidatus Adiutrix sp.]